MIRRTWCTKEDVLKDLEVASGQRVTDVDDGFFVVGERPPPPRVFGIDDDEIELQFGQAATTPYDEFTSRPDLKGITKMIRNVQDNESSPFEETIRPGSAKEAIVISKLNPYVKEFIPKSSQNVSSQNVSVSRSNTIITNNFTGAKSTEIKVCAKRLPNKLDQTENLSSHVERNLKADVAGAKEQPTEIKTKSVAEMAVILKNTINKSKEDTFEEKKQKNSAIVKLLKLYTAPKPAEPAKPVKLYPPEFFETCKASDFADSSFVRKTSIYTGDEVKHNDKHIENTQNYTGNASSEIFKDHTDKGTIRIKEIVKNDYVVYKNNEEVIASVEETSLTPKMADTSIGLRPEVKETPVDPETAESISKVNEWFEYENRKKNVAKEKPQAPVAYFGAIAYKRKDPVTCKSPSDVGDKKIPKPSVNDQPSSDAYQPSSYAQELLQKYQGNKKKAPPLNIWDKLEADLKKKDAEIIDRKNKV